MPDLAVVIPAFKPDFFRDTLASLAAQTSTDFTVYVGNDGGPREIGDIGSDFPELSIRYERFDENLGGTSLVAHWNRCVRLSTEPWVWLLSDDDVVAPGCVEAFLGHGKDGIDVVRFDTETIDATGQRIREHEPHPRSESAEDFLFARLEGRRHSFVVEYLFRRSAFDRTDGFIDFPVAWCADDASWFAFAGGAPIETLPSGMVSWRASGVNITDANEERQEEKLEAAFRFLDFVDEHVRPESTRPAASWEAAQLRWLHDQIRHVMPLSPALLHSLVERTEPRWPIPTARRASRMAAWNAVATLKAVRGRVRRALRSR